MKPLKAVYITNVFCLSILTSFTGPDGFNRAMVVSGLPDEKAARDFLKHMGWDDIPFSVHTMP